MTSRRVLFFETLTILILIILTFSLSVFFDIFEKIIDFAWKHEEYEIDEIFSLLGISSIYFLIFLIRRVKDLHNSFNKLESLAVIDSLTGILNRRKILELIDKELLRVRRYSSVATLIILDYDKFKNINDTFGHTAGDYVLRNISEQISVSLRDSDSLGRLGGDEFVILLPNQDRAEGLIIAERIRKKISSKPLNYKGSDIFMSLSLGVIQITGKEENVPEIINNADSQLYKSKNEGRNKVR